MQLLERRLETARHYEAASAAVQRLEDLYRLLKLQYQRNAASPSMRLLDDVLEILGDPASIDDGGDPFASAKPGEHSRSVAGAHMKRRNEAMSRMQSAFTGGAPAGIDIFAAAAALAEAGPLAAEELSVEYVRIHDFLAGEWKCKFRMDGT